MFERVLDTLSTGGYASAGASRALLRGENPLRGLAQGVHDRLTYGDLLREHGVTNPWVSIPAGLALDVALDPTTYLGIGTLTHAGQGAKAATLGSKLAHLSGDTVRIAEAADKLAHAGELGAKLAQQGARGQRAAVSLAGRSLLPAPVNEALLRLADHAGEVVGNTEAAQALRSAFLVAPELRGMDRQAFLARKAEIRAAQVLAEKKAAETLAPVSGQISRIARAHGINSRAMERALSDAVELSRPAQGENAARAVVRAVDSGLAGFGAPARAELSPHVHDMVAQINAMNAANLTATHAADIPITELGDEAINYLRRVVRPEARDVIRRFGAGDEVQGVSRLITEAHGAQKERAFKGLTVSQINDMAEAGQLSISGGHPIPGGLFEENPFIATTLRSGEAAKAIASSRLLKDWARVHGWVPRSAEAALGIKPFSEVAAESEAHAAKNLGQLADEAIAKFGPDVSADNARELFRDYSASFEGRSRYAAAVHEGSSAVTKEWYRRMLERPIPPGGGRVVVTGGGPGSGKTAGLRMNKAVAKEAEIVFDAAMGRSSTRAIRQALDSGRSVDFMYTVRGPAESWRAALKRAEQHGRTVPADLAAESHGNAVRRLQEMLAEFDPEIRSGKMTFHLIDNTHGPGGAIAHAGATALDAAGALPHHNQGELEREFRAILEKGREHGQVSPRVHAGSTAVTQGRSAGPVSGGAGANPALAGGDAREPAALLRNRSGAVDRPPPGWIHVPSQIPGLEAAYYPPDVAKALRAHFESVVQPGYFLRKWDAAQSMWKKYTLGIFPVYHTRNEVGDLWNAAVLGGMDVRRIGDALNVLWKQGEARSLGRGGGGAVVRLGGKSMDGSRVLELADRLGVTQGGIMGEVRDALRTVQHLPSSAWDAAGQKVSNNAALRMGEAVGTFRENTTRLALFMDRLGKGDAPEAAASYVKQHLFDYGELTPTEQQVFRRLMPFYSFTRFNVPLQLGYLFRKPGAFAALEKVRNEVAGDQSLGTGNEAPLPRFLREGTPVRMGENADGNPQFARMEGWLPATDAAIAMDPAAALQRGVGLLSPFIQQPIETALNVDLFRSDLGSGDFQPQERFPGETETMLGVPLNKRFVRAPLENVRALTELDKLNPFGVFGDAAGGPMGQARPHPDPSGPVRLASLLAGRAYAVDPETEAMRYTNQQKREISRLRTELRRAYARGDASNAAVLERRIMELGGGAPAGE